MRQGIAGRQHSGDGDELDLQPRATQAQQTADEKARRHGHQVHRLRVQLDDRRQHRDPDPDPGNQAHAANATPADDS